MVAVWKALMHSAVYDGNAKTQFALILHGLSEIVRQKAVKYSAD